MTAAMTGDLCRVTVEGPDKRVDLAVPASTTVAALLPVLLWHTADQAKTDLARPEESWVLQRLGGEPFDPTGTPESLDWLEGEKLYLRPVENQLPVLHFDDISEGIADTVTDRRDRWRPEFRRQLFIGVSAVVAATLAVTLIERAPTAPRIGMGVALTILYLVATVQFARLFKDRGLSLLFGLAACAHAGLVVVDLVDGGQDRLAFTMLTLSAGSAAAAAAAVLLVIVQRLWATAIPYPVFLIVAVLAVALNALNWLQSTVGVSSPAAAGTVATVLFGLVLFAPNLVLRAGQLRGPQLPKTAEELQYDYEPYPADVMERRANDADNYLTVLVVSTSLALPVLFPTIMSGGGWAGWSLVAVLSGIVLLRARVLLNVWQRVSFTGCGSIGVIMLVARFTGTASPSWLVMFLLGLLLLLAITVVAALRPWPRRMLPVWEFTAGVLDVIGAVALIPLTLQLMHAYSWARGLAG